MFRSGNKAKQSHKNKSAGRRKASKKQQTKQLSTVANDTVKVNHTISTTTPQPTLKNVKNYNPHHNSHHNFATKAPTSTKKRSKNQHSAITLDALTLGTLPTPKSILVGEQLQEEEDKRFKDDKSPLRSANMLGFSFDLPQMSKLHIPTTMNINAINDVVKKHGGNDGSEIMLMLKTPEESIPNWSKLTKTEQLLLENGFIALVPGSTNYTYLPLAMRVLDKLINMIADEMVSGGSQKVELPGIVEKNLLDQFQLYRQRMVQQNEAINAQKTIDDRRNGNGDPDGDAGEAGIARKRKAGEEQNGEKDDENHDNSLAQSIYDNQLSPYYRFYNLQDEELIVSPPLLDYYTSLVKNQVKLANQLPLSFFQISKKLRDVNDQNALLNSSINISEANESIGFMKLNQKDKKKLIGDKKQEDDEAEDDSSVVLSSDNIPQHPSFSAKGKSHQTETVMNGLITSTEYQTMNNVTFHHDANDAHDMYKSTLEMFNRLFRKLGVPGVQVEADGGRVGAELSHEYHLVIGTTAESKTKEKKRNHQAIQSNTHALVQCGLCNYTANTENAQFQVGEQFDQALYNQRMKTGDLTRAMRQDPRSFGIFEATGGDPQFDRDIRSKATGLVKQMLPNLARRDVPMVANVVKLVYAPGQDGFYDFGSNINDFGKDQLQFINHAVIMLRADREFNPRAIARHFGCHDVELLSAAESALLLLKFQKFKQKQYQELIRAGVVEAFDPNFNIFSELHNKPLPVSSRDVQGMYEDMNDTTLIEKEQRRLRRLAAKRDVNAGLVIVCDNTLAASGIDLDDQEMMDDKFLEAQNKDRSFGLKLAETGQKQTGKHLIDRLKGYQTATDFQSTQQVPPEFARQFETIFKGIKEGIITVTKNGDIILNDVPEEMEDKFQEFMSLPNDETLEHFKSHILKHKLQNGEDIIDAEVVEKNGEAVSLLRTKRKISLTREELEHHRQDLLAQGINIDEISDSELLDIELSEGDATEQGDDDDGNSEEKSENVYEGQVLPILQDESFQHKSTAEIFESAMEDSRTYRQNKEKHQHDHEHHHHHHHDDEKKTDKKDPKSKKLIKNDNPDSPIDMYTNEHGDYVDADGKILPHITSDLPASPDVRRAFGKKGYDQLGEGGDDEDLNDPHNAISEQLLSTVNPSQGDFTAPQSGDRCIQSSCQSQGMLEGLRSIEIGKVFFLADSLTRNTDAVVIDNRMNKYGAISYKKKPIHMTSSKIGVTRLMHALVESGQYDEHGLMWPELIAPYQISFITDPTPQVNFSRSSKKVLDKNGKVAMKLVDVYENYTNQAQLAQEEYFNDLKEQEERLDKLKRTPGISPSLDKQRNLLIQDAEDLINAGYSDEARLRFGHWNWGLADNNTHTLNLAAAIAKTVPTLEDEVIHDDRYHMTVNQRVQDSFAMGIPWVVVIDEMMQDKGLVKVINRATKYVENLSVDQVIHFFNGQRPAHQRPEQRGTDFEREMKYKVENALLSHFGKRAAHEGDSDFFKIQATSEAFDYNTHVDLRSSNQTPQEEEDTTPRFDEDGNVVNLPDSLKKSDMGDETALGLKAQEQAATTGEVSQDIIDQNTPENDKSALLDDTIEDAIRSLNNQNAAEDKKDKDSKEPQVPPKKGKAVDEWYHKIKKLRRRLPPPTADELDRMFRVGILYKDTKGEVQINAIRANANIHVVYGVDPQVVDQFERGNLLDLDRTGAGVRQVIDKHEYLQQQRVFTAQRIEKQIESGHFDLSLTPHMQAKKTQQEEAAEEDYKAWQLKQEQRITKTSPLASVEYNNPYVHYTAMQDQRRDDLKKNGVVFRKISDGSAIVHRPHGEPEARPFDVRYDAIDSSKQDKNPLQSTPPPQQRQPVQMVQPRKKKSISEIFGDAPVQQPREGKLYEEVFGPNTHIKDNFGQDAYEKIFGNKNAK